MMENVVLVRIDDRLIHGQVMTSWLNFTQATKIMVIDDDVAGDLFMKNVLKNAVPGNVGLGVFSVDRAAERLVKGFKDHDKVIILVKFPKTLYRLLEKGIKFDNINIGGMGANINRHKFYKNISASDEEREIFKNMMDKGCKLEIRIIAEDNRIDIAKYL
ncbi:PTS sugar transporter subunit IIB [Pectinatus haikarae]|uniref:PTS system mannose-specific IIB component n=1 Tax=Pectinatus haikarae TaxID=349096 RepID=A0ABT9Y5Y5_9FIRM|nr:PTS sugar transporter subunit IIB [Pectinatus haikarae]MDQ0203243.1 PTS system mannose-specific IIB component [Pectinatus haikarae]